MRKRRIAVLRLRARDVHYPLNAELIYAHTKRVAPYGFLEWHGNHAVEEC